MDNHKSSTLPDIRQTEVFNAPIQKVWDAVATSEGIAAWFMPNDFQPIVGHEFHLNAGPFGMSPCKVTEIDPPRRLSFRWGKDWTLTFELAEVEGKTQFTLIHSGWDADTVTEFGQPHTVVRDQMNAGWGGLAKKLGAYVEAK
ncbi:SRPBCC domain-containing protein [Paenibacillus sp. P26]|nr:SRPBCC domain-containing protein [Paenibacillus sp. P26]UUZ91841.1 SRPBCC domain-containing protein [Paenibacillus sp. P25]